VGIREKHVLREAAKEVLIPEVYDRQKHPFTTPPTRNENDPMLAFYRDTFASQAAKDQPIYDMKKVATTLDQLLESSDDQRIAVEGGLQRVATVIVIQELFSMARAAGRHSRATCFRNDYQRDRSGMLEHIHVAAVQSRLKIDRNRRGPQGAGGSNRPCDS
jgi:asparagine synthase